LFLSAFWDPYSKLASLPVAVVNNDAGGFKDGNSVNYGKDILDKLKNNSTVGWKFVSQDEGKNGLEKGTYYAMFVIPEDFSKNILSAKNGTIVQPKIAYSDNEKINFIASQIDGKVQLELNKELSKTITDEYTVQAFNSLYELKDGMASATVGSGEIKTGIKDAYTGSGTLKSGLGTLVAQVPGLNSGIIKLYDGSSSLLTGLNQASSGVSALNGGASQLKAGASNLKLGVTALTDAINTSAVDANGNPVGLLAGVTKLGDGTTQLNAAVSGADVDANGNPQSLAGGYEAIYNAVNTHGTNAYGLPVGLGDGVALINSQINTPTGVAGHHTNLANGVADLNDSVAALGGYTQNAQAGLVALKTQLSDFSSGAGLSTEQQNALNQIIAGYLGNNPSTPTVMDAITGINAGVNGAGGLKDSAAYLNAGINSTDPAHPGLAASIAQMNQSINVGSLNTQGKPAPSLRAALDTMHNNLPTLVTAMQVLDGSVNGVKNSSGVVVQRGLLQGITQLSQQVANQLLPGTIALAQGSSDLYNGTTSLNSGLTSAVAGSTQLNNGLYQVKNSVPALNDGVNKLYNGSGDLNDGLSKLSTGTTELNNKLSDGSNKLNSNLVNTSEDMGKFVSDPIQMTSSAVNPVANYGTGFTPYFIPISLWLGALLMFFLITDKIDDDIKAGSRSVVIGKYLSYGFIGAIQAMTVSIIVLMLGLRPTNIFLYFVFNIFMSYVFIAIIQSFVFLLGMAGRLLAIVMLVMQLTSSGGMFPMELVPNFFKAVHPFVPFTYCTQALREIISGTDYVVLGQDVSVLLVFMVVFLTISIVMKDHADKVAEKIQLKKLEMETI
jgi:putative membrane protein